MKKTRILSLILASLVVLSLLVSCGKKTVDEEGAATVVVALRDGTFEAYEVNLSLLESSDEGALSLLEYLASKEGSGFTYTVNTSGGYGAYVEAISSLKPQAMSNEYISVYTSEESDFAVPTEYMPSVASIEYNGIILKYSGVGISSMTIKDGTVILFCLETY